MTTQPKDRNDTAELRAIRKLFRGSIRSLKEVTTHGKRAWPNTSVPTEQWDELLKIVDGLEELVERPLL
jgi:hypothetical protein